MELIKLESKCFCKKNMIKTLFYNIHKNIQTFNKTFLFSLLKTNQTSDICCFALPSAGQSPSSSSHSSSSEGSPQTQRLNECEQLMPLSGLSANTCEPSLDAINVGQIDSSASRSSGKL